MLCARFGWNWTNGSSEEDFLISSMYWRYFLIISPWKTAGPSFKQTGIPFTQGCIVPSLVEIDPVYFEKFFLISPMYFRYLLIVSPLENSGGLPFVWTNLTPPKDALCQLWLNWPSGFWEVDENVKSFQQQGRRTMDKFWSENLAWAFGSGDELKMGKLF